MTEMMTGTFLLPDLGEGLSEAEIINWHVAPGDRVVADQPLVTVETDKAVVDIPSPGSGVVEACLGEPGDVVAVGEPLLRFSGAAGRQDAGAVVGELPQAVRGEPKRPAEPAPEAEPARSAQAAAAPIHRAEVKASPRARKRARELGVELGSVIGTGPHRVIQVRDVEAAVVGAGDRLEGVRRAMARRMADADQRVVRATVTGEADISAWSRSSRPGSPILRLLRAMAVAVEAAPRMNAWFDDRAERVANQATVNVGIAMETQDGLFVPVLRDVAGKSQVELEAELDRLQGEVESRTIRPDELRGATISLSNFGAIGGLYAEMVVVPPQVAIIGAGRAFERVVLRDGAPAAANMLPLSVTFDHRVLTGVEACTYLLAMTADLELEE